MIQRSLCLLLAVTLVFTSTTAHARRGAPPLMPIYIEGDVPDAAAAPANAAVSTSAVPARRVAMKTVAMKGATTRTAAIDRRPYAQAYGGAELKTTQSSPSTSTPQRFGLGAELGISGRAGDANGSLSSTQLFMGGRIVGRFPFLRENIYLKPSVGFFFRPEGTSSVGINQQVLEAGVVAQWAFAKGGRTRWLLGVANRVDLMWNTLSSFGVSATTPMTARYRIGPAIGGLFGISKDLSFSADFETTFSFAPVRPAMSLTGGFIYYW